MNKSVLITGGARGLGFAFVEKFLKEGWNVYTTVRSTNDAIRLKQLNKLLCFPIIVDITSENVQSELISQIDESVRFNVVINNAGAGSTWNCFEETELNDVKHLFDVHCLGVMNICQAILPLLIDDGIIINVSSRFGSISKTIRGELDHITCSYSYRIAKSAQNMFTLSLSKEFHGTDKRICAIHPGQLKTSSASKDANREPSEAAEKLYLKLDSFENGVFYDLFGGILDW